MAEKKNEENNEWLCRSGEGRVNREYWWERIKNEGIPDNLGIETDRIKTKYEGAREKRDNDRGIRKEWEKAG